MKTNEQWFKENLTKEQHQQVINNINSEPEFTYDEYKVMESSTLGSALRGGFVFSKSPQGHDYWWLVCVQ